MISSNDKIIAFLPLSTYLQRVYIYMSIILKADVVISNAFMVFDHIKREKPTIFIAIPYLYSSVEQNFMTAINKNKKGKRFLKLYSFLKKLGLMKRFKPFADVWGGNIRILASGSSPLQMTTYDFYEKMGIPIYQAYGMNEVGILTSNTPKHNKKGSVGRPCNGMKITISDDEEIIVESEYSTNSEYGDGKAFAVDNKIHTNDLGHIDKDGFVFITGRKNNTIVLANGKKVMPETEESVLEKFQEVTNALVYSEDKVSLKAVVSITEDSNEQELVKAFKGLQREGKLSSEIFAFEIIREGFSSKNNLLTPNMKKNRKYKQSTTAELVS
jgi:long-chain acyl-CoA synthetase